MRTFALFLLFLIIDCNVVFAKKHTTSPQKVIIDTNLDSDVDDVGAMAMLYNLNHAGEIELLGVIITSHDPHALVCAAALNTFYGLPERPVGFLNDQSELRHAHGIQNRYQKNFLKE